MVVFQAAKPEIAEIIGLGGGGLSGRLVDKPAFGTDNDLFFIGIVERAADEFFWQVLLIDPRLGLGSRVDQFGLIDKGLKIRFFTKAQGIGGALIHTAGDLPLRIVVQQMGASCALLSNVQIFIEKDGVMGAGIGAELAAHALLRVDNDQPIIALIDCLGFTIGDAGCIVAMVAHFGNIGHLDFGHLSANQLGQTQPELPGIGLRFGIGCPVVGHMFILASNLAAVAAVTNR
jgi:hypothetical protein